MIDFHTHILPGMDDGATSPEEALQMLECCATQGIKKVVATSHFYAENESPEQFCKRQKSAYQQLKTVTDGKDLPQVVLGAEVLYFEGISDCDYLELLKIEGTRAILVEMPFAKWSPRMIREVADIFDKRNLVPIIAHIDRYIAIFNKRSIAKSFENLPVLIQANAEFFTSKKTARFANSLVKKGKVHLLGSDCHNMTTRKPDYKEGIKNLSADALFHIETFENAVFENDMETLLMY